jgi:hypothetical protein
VRPVQSCRESWRRTRASVGATRTAPSGRTRGAPRDPEIGVAAVHHPSRSERRTRDAPRESMHRGSLLPSEGSRSSVVCRVRQPCDWRGTALAARSPGKSQGLLRECRGIAMSERSSPRRRSSARARRRSRQAFHGARVRIVRQSRGGASRLARLRCGRDTFGRRGLPRNRIGTGAPTYLGLLAEVCEKVDQPDEGLAVVADALDVRHVRNALLGCRAQAAARSAHGPCVGHPGPRAGAEALRPRPMPKPVSAAPSRSRSSRRRSRSTAPRGDVGDGRGRRSRSTEAGNTYGSCCRPGPTTPPGSRARVDPRAFRANRERHSHPRTHPRRRPSR